MEIINNRYRILETEYSNRVFSCHVAKDILYPNEESFRIFIVKPQMMPSLAMQKFISDFLVYSSIKHPYIVKGEHVDMIFSIDRKPVERTNYYFVVEKFDYNTSFLDYSYAQTDSDILLDKFIDILRIFELMIRRGFYYDFASTEHIYLDDNHNIKIKDFLLTQIENISFSSHEQRADLKYRAPELYSGERTTILSVIYALGIVLKSLLKNPSFEANFGNKIKPVIDKMTAYRYLERYMSITQIIEDINFFCDKDYEFLFEDKNYYIDRKPGLVIRDSIKNSIFKGVNNLKAGDCGVLLYEIKGDRNTGKTKTLRHIRKQLSLNGVNIFASFDEDRPILKYKSMLPVVSKILAERGYDIINKYEKVKAFLKSGSCEKDDYTSYSQINTFIKTAIDSQLTAIIIDDLKETDVDSIEIIKYLMYDKKLKEKLLIIYTSEDNIPLEKTESYMLNNLTIDETTQLIKSILCIDYNPIDIATRIYKDTIGNIKHVKNILFELIDQRILELDNAGKWIFKSDKYDDLKISEESLESPQKYLEVLNYIQQEAIINLSLFKNPSTAEDLATMYSRDIKLIDIVDSLMDLVKAKILITQFNDDGYYYEFEDRGFKKKVYDSIPADIKLIKHKQMAQNIMSMKKSLKGRRLDELIYHLKKSQSRKEASIYAIKKAEEYYKAGSIVEALEMDKEAIEQAVLSKDHTRQIITYQKAGNRCLKEGMLSKGNDYFKDSLIIAKSINNHKVILVTLNKIADVYMQLNDFVLAKATLDEIAKALKSYSNTKAQLDYYISMLSYLIKIGEYESAKKWIESAETLCQGKYKKHYAWVLYYKGVIYHEEGYSTEELLALHEKILDLFIHTGDKMGIAQTYNSFGFIYSEYLLDNQNAMHYFKLMKDFAEANKLMPQVAISNFNLGEAVLRNLNYEDAIDYFNKSIEASISLKKKDLVFYAYIYMAHIMIEILDFSNADVYIKKAEYLFDESIKYDRAILFYHEIKTVLNMYVGSKEIVKKHVKEIVDSKIKLMGFQAITSKAVSLFAKLDNLKSSEEAQNILREIFEVTKELSRYPYSVKRFLDIGLIAKYFSESELINEIYSWVLDNVDIKESNRAKNIRDYMKYYINSTDARADHMEMLAVNLNPSLDMRLLFQVNLILSEDYIKNKHYFIGVSYLVENYIKLKDKIYSFNKEMNLDNFLGLLLSSIITRILSIEDLHLSELEKIDIYNSNVESIKAIVDENTILKVLLKDKTFTDEAKKHLNWDRDELSTDSIIENLKYSNIGNIEFLLKQLMTITWAQTGGIYLRQDKEINCISSVNDIRDTQELEMIFNQVDVVQDKLIVSEFVENSDSIFKSILPSQAKGFMCIPIYTDNLQLNDRRLTRNNIIGYVYLESKMVLNSFTEESYVEIGKFINLLSAFIDNYNLSLKYSIDKLTQAYNRQYFDIFIKNELESAQGQKSMFSLVIMDIDFFKSVNDTFGHGFGDITLKRFSKIVQGSIRSSDLFARYGGEEFVLVLKHTSAVEAYSIADRIREKMYNELKDLEGKPITVSMGISTYPEHGVWEEELINKADIALYKAKDSGRNKVCIWDNTLNNSEIFDRKKENIIASIFGENHQRSNLFVNSINLIKTSDGDTEVFDKYILDVLKYFEAEKLFIIKYEDSEIESLIKGTSQGTFVIKHGFENQINLNIVKTCYDEEKSLYLTDWEQVSKLDELTGMPEWDSVLSTPIIHKGKKKGVLYMCAPVRFKEFSIVDSSVAQIIAPIIGDFM